VTAWPITAAVPAHGGNVLVSHTIRHGRPALPAPARGFLPLAAPNLQTVRDFIAANLADKLTLPQIASQVHLSPSHFARQFKTATGMSLHQYILERRLLLAYDLLLTTNLPIGEIAALVGFADHSHLTHCFKRRFGVPPHIIRLPA
jgi:AraC family transcriptional regulator